MNYHDFKQQIISTLSDRLGSDVRITVSDILKNNDTHLDGLTILAPGQNLAPTIYLDYYYGQYERGRSFSDITDDILTAYRENRPKSPVDISFFTDYDKVKSRVTMKLINYERNRELFKQVPYYRFLDLAIVFLCLVESDSSGTATVLIHNEHLTYWGITRDDLYALAMANTPQLLRYDLRSMTEVLRELFADEFADPAGSDLIERFSDLRSVQPAQLNGSSCILYQHLLHDFARRIGSQFLYSAEQRPRSSSDSRRQPDQYVHALLHGPGRQFVPAGQRRDFVGSRLLLLPRDGPDHYVILWSAHDILIQPRIRLR